jgi:sugar lactone lactonase YvrE
MIGLESINGGKAWYYCEPRMILGEAPIYRASDSTLHWVDCLANPPLLYILRVDPATGDAIGSARVLELSDSVTLQFSVKTNQAATFARTTKELHFSTNKPEDLMS